MLEEYLPQGSLLHPGVKIKDIRRKFPSLVQCSDYYSLLILHEKGDEVTICSQSTSDFKALGQLVRESGALFFFPPCFHVQVVIERNRSRILTSGSEAHVPAKILGCLTRG